MLCKHLFEKVLSLYQVLEILSLKDIGFAGTCFFSDSSCFDGHEFDVVLGTIHSTEASEDDCLRRCQILLKMILEVHGIGDMNFKRLLTEIPDVTEFD